jgi:hypothetical protein
LRKIQCCESITTKPSKDVTNEKQQKKRNDIDKQQHQKKSKTFDKQQKPLNIESENNH